VHDIKNYAAGIEGNIGVLSRKHPENESIKRTLSLVKNTCFDIVNLTSNLLDIGKMEESKLEPNKALIHYDQIRKVVNQFKENILFEERNISIQIIPPLDKFSIEADMYLLTRVFQNLFNNAAKYVPRGGKVVVSMESGIDEDIVCFFSTGKPIPEKDKEIIFDKYSSLDDKRNIHSKGLGLFFCRLVAQSHGGRIWLDTDEHGNYFKLAFKKTPVRTTA
jgi:K+-sensing histidine kinase KdpD